MNLKDQLDALLDATAFDSTGTKVGAVRQVYVDDESGKITFATVSTGIFSADAIVPLYGARLLDDELHVDHTRAVIRDSPRPDRTEDGLTPDQEFRLLEHYGIDAPAPGRADSGVAPEPTREPTPAAGDEKTDGDGGGGSGGSGGSSSDNGADKADNGDKSDRDTGATSGTKVTPDDEPGAEKTTGPGTPAAPSGKADDPERPTPAAGS